MGAPAIESATHATTGDGRVAVCSGPRGIDWKLRAIPRSCSTSCCYLRYITRPAVVFSSRNIGRRRPPMSSIELPAPRPMWVRLPTTSAGSAAPPSRGRAHQTSAAAELSGRKVPRFHVDDCRHGQRTFDFKIGCPLVDEQHGISSYSYVSMNMGHRHVAPPTQGNAARENKHHMDDPATKSSPRP